jgi:hypothetical protein
MRKNDAPPGVMKSTTAIARGKYGYGRVVCFSPHPEKTPGLEKFLQWAVRWAALSNADDHGSHDRQPQSGESR